MDFNEFMANRLANQPQKLQGLAPSSTPGTTPFLDPNGFLAARSGRAAEPSPAALPSQSMAGQLLSSAKEGTIAGLASALRLTEEMSRQYGEMTGIPIGPELVEGLSASGVEYLDNWTKEIQAQRDPALTQILQHGSIKGTLWKPQTWEIDSSDPGQFLSHQLAQGLGQLAPIIVTAALTGGTGAAVLGGLMEGGSSMEQAEAIVDDAHNRGLLAEYSPRYNELMKEGMTPDEAYQEIRNDASDLGALSGMTIGGLGGAATSAIFKGALSRSVVASIGISAGEEALQETAAGLGAKGAAAGAARTTEIPESFGEGTFGDALLGAMVGAPVGAVGGLRSKPDQIPDSDDLSELGEEELGTSETPPSDENAYEEPEGSLVTTATPSPVESPVPQEALPSLGTPSVPANSPVAPQQGALMAAIQKIENDQKQAEANQQTQQVAIQNAAKAAVEDLVPKVEVDPETKNLLMEEDLVDLDQLDDLDDLDLEFEPLEEPIAPNANAYKPIFQNKTKGGVSSIPSHAVLGKSAQNDKTIYGYEYLGPKGGSADGGLYFHTPTSQTVIAKKYKEDAQVGNEIIANNLIKDYKLHYNNLPLQPSMFATTVEGKAILNSPVLPDFEPFNPDDPAHTAMARQDFVLNAWLGNWDVFGKEWDNVLVTPDGLSYVDLGGSMMYRAMGAKKGLQWNDLMTELDTLKDKNPKVYGTISDTAIQLQAESLLYRMSGTGIIDTTIELDQTLTMAEKEALRRRLYNRLTTLAYKLKLEHLSPQAVTGNKYGLGGDSYFDDLNPVNDKLLNPVQSKALLTKAVDDLEHQAEVFQVFNEKLIQGILSHKTHNLVKALLQDKQVLAMLNHPGYAKWSKGNKIFWDVKEYKIAFFANPEGLGPMDLFTKHNLLPPILFRGSQGQMFKDPDTGTYIPYPSYDMKKAGGNQGGGDTHLGMFLTENPEVAVTYTPYATDSFYNAIKTRNGGYKLDKLTIQKVVPFVVNLNPYVVDFGGSQWSADKSILYAEQAKKLGYNSLVMVNVQDKGGKQVQVIVFNPDSKHVKSPFAQAFDPTVNHFKASIMGNEYTGVSLSSEDIVSLKAMMKRMGLDTTVNLGFFQSGTHAGMMTAKTSRGLQILINSALKGPQTFKGTLHHEAIHALVELGFFDTVAGKKMWRVLKAEARKRGVSDHVKNNYVREDWIEESIAMMFEQWVDEPGTFESDGPLFDALTKLRKFFEGLGNWLLGRGFTTWEDAFTYLTTQGDEIRTIVEYLQDAQLSAAQGTIKASILAAKKVGVKAPNTGNVDYYTNLVKHGWSVLQLAKKNLHIPWLQEYVQHASQWQNAKSEWLSHANETVGKWNNLVPAQQRALAKTLFEVEQMTYRTPQEVIKGVVRKPTKAELLAIFKKNKLTNDSIKVYTQVRADFDAMLNKIESVTVDSISRMLAHNTLARDLEIAKAKGEFKALRKAPYFPHARFGTYTIVVKENGKVVYAEMFETEKARNAAMAAVQSKFKGSKYVIAKSKLSEEAQIYRGIPHSLLVAMKANLNLQPKQVAALEEMIVHSLPSVSFKNHFAKKENIAGYSEDALRAYADYFWHGANHIARIEYGPLMEESIAKAQDDINTMINTGLDSTKRVKMRDHLLSHFESIMNPKEDWAALRSMGFLWWLGFNVKSAVLNFTQVPMVTYAHLGAHFGDIRAQAGLARSMAKLQGLYRSPDKAVSQANKADLELIARGIKEGFLDESFAAELAGFAEGSNLSQSMAKTSLRRAVITFNHMAGYMFQTMEKVNRRVSFIAAVDLARANPNAKYLNEVRTRFNLEYQTLLNQGMAPAEAVAFLAGKDTVESTQFNYSAWARPKIMEGKKSAFFTFFMFTQNMLWFIQNSPGSSRYLMMLLLFGGIMGMPFADDLEEVVKSVAKIAFGEHYSIEKELRELLVDMMGEDGPPPDLFLKGISRYGFGLKQFGDMIGLPLPSVDMSGNIGMGSPLPVISPAIQAVSGLAQEKDFDEVLGTFTAEGVGATLSIPINLLKALSDSRMEFTDRKRWETAMPAAMSALSKATRYWQEGAERTRTGAKIVEYDRSNPVHTAEIIAQGLGFRPTRTAQTWDAIIMKREAENFWTTRRGLLLRQYDWAKESGDDAAVKDVKAAINRFNQTVPTSKMKITYKTLSRSYKQRELAREKVEEGVPRAKMMDGVYKEIERLHPELKVHEAYDELPSGR